MHTEYIEMTVHFLLLKGKERCAKKRRCIIKDTDISEIDAYDLLPVFKERKEKSNKKVSKKLVFGYIRNFDAKTTRLCKCKVYEIVTSLGGRERKADEIKKLILPTSVFLRKLKRRKKVKVIQSQVEEIVFRVLDVSRKYIDLCGKKIVSKEMIEAVFEEEKRHHPYLLFPPPLPSLPEKGVGKERGILHHETMSLTLHSLKKFGVKISSDSVNVICEIITILTEYFELRLE